LGLGGLWLTGSIEEVTAGFNEYPRSVNILVERFFFEYSLGFSPHLVKSRANPDARVYPLIENKVLPTADGTSKRELAEISHITRRV
jgi:hypothetical protein